GRATAPCSRREWRDDAREGSRSGEGAAKRDIRGAAVQRFGVWRTRRWGRGYGASIHGRARAGDSPPGQRGWPLRLLSRSWRKTRNNPGRDRSTTLPVQTAASPTRTGNEWSKTRITGSARDRSDPTTRNADLQAWDRIARP